MEMVKPTFLLRTSRILQVSFICFILFHFTHSLRKQAYKFCIYSRTQLIRINLDGEPSRYAENSDNWIFL